VEPNEILKRPYARVLTPEPDGQVTAEIMEFPGCVAYGRDSADALSNLEKVAVDWIAAALEQGQNIPEPMAANDFSGKTVLRMTKGLHQRATLYADREGVSLNQFIVTCLAECVGERSRPPAFVPQFQVMATASFQVAGTSSGALFRAVPAHSGATEIMAATAGPAVPVPQWRKLERRHA
jgi:antitoxin HicB